MARTVPLQDSFQGMKRDFSRAALPKGAVWNLVDFIPNLNAPLRKRGGYAYASANITSTKATASQVVAGVYAEYTGGAKNLAVDEDGELYVIVSSASTTDVGAAVVPAQNPVFHRQLAVIPANDGTTSPKSYDGSSLSTLAGTPPTGVYATVYKDRTVLGRSATNLNRVWFSGAGDPTTWNTTTSWIDTSDPITGLASLRNAILIFHTGKTERLRGSTPPPGSDFILDPLFETGCTDARSIALAGDNCVFANPGGVYLTDGAALIDLTAKAGIKSYWRDTLATYSSSSWTIAGGVYSGKYVFTVMNGASFVDAGMIDISQQTFMRLSNIDARCYWHAAAASEELYFGRRGAARVGQISNIFAPTATVKNDGDGTAVAPIMETAFFTGGEAKATWRTVFLTYDLRDAASDNPILTCSYVTSPESASYTALTPTFSETTQRTYARAPLRFSSLGVAFKIAQTNASSDTRLSALAVDTHSREESRVA